MELTTELRKDSKGSYLIITIQPEEKGYKGDMLENNEVFGLLPVKAQEFNNCCQLWYDVTGKSSLKEQFRQNAPGTTEISELFRQAAALGEILENYLLDPNDLLLDLAYIFMGEDCNYSFVYVPDYKMETGSQMKKLLESLMECMNYENRQAVSLVYLLHSGGSQKECSIFSFWQLCKEILHSEKREEEKEEEYYSAETADVMAQNEKYRDKQINTDEGINEKSWKKRLSKIWKKLFKKAACFVKEDRQYMPEEEMGLQRQSLYMDNSQYAPGEGMGLRNQKLYIDNSHTPGEEMGLQNQKLYMDNSHTPGEGIELRNQKLYMDNSQYASGEGMGSQRQKLYMDNSQYAPGEGIRSAKIPSITGEWQQDTVLLSSETSDTVLLSNIEAEFVLEPVENAKEPIPLTSFPFHLGKEQSVCGYVFTEAVISRHHARIQQEGTDYYLVDLASLNGTFLNGERLKKNECRKIVIGDILGFADIFYIFTCPKSSNVI